MGNLNKRAIVFTFIVVVLLSVILIAFLINLNTKVSQNKIQFTNVKVETINSFVKNLNSVYIPDALRISSNQVMISLLDYESNHTYVNGVDDYFRQVLADGNYHNAKQEDMSQNNLNYILPNTLDEIKKLAIRQGIIFNYLPIDYNTLTLTQKDPWRVTVTLKLSYTLNDVNNEIYWTINNKEFSSILKVTDYRDPLHLVEEKPGISLKIANVSHLYAINNFNLFIENSNFTVNPSAPSFLNRLEQGKKNIQSENGIESILNPVYYKNTKKASNVDYQYYNNVNGLCVMGMPEDFRLDQAHINYYGKTNCL
jgi:hypothetical protein